MHRVKGENKNEKLKTVAGVGNIYSKSDVNKIGLYLSKHENCLFN